MKYRFTKRTGGNSHGAFASLNLGTHVGDDIDDVLKNREAIARECGPTQYMNQVHGDRIALIEEVTDEIPTADALVTGIPGITLAVMVADCIPLLLSSRESVAAVHVGRKGLVNEVTRKTISLMRDMGATEITAIIGPAICGTCYEVSEEIHREVISLHPQSDSRTSQGTFALDLPRALIEVLKSEGVKVIDESTCTLEDVGLYSYRRDGVTGRQAGLISL
jgi:YfiH family protein